MHIYSLNIGKSGMYTSVSISISCSYIVTRYSNNAFVWVPKDRICNYSPLVLKTWIADTLFPEMRRNRFYTVFYLSNVVYFAPCKFITAQMLEELHIKQVEESERGHHPKDTIIVQSSIPDSSSHM